jgi:predicted Zn-dependent protease
MKTTEPDQDPTAKLHALARLRQREPNNPVGYTKALALLHEAGRTADADALLAAALRRPAVAAAIRKEATPPSVAQPPLAVMPSGAATRAKGFAAMAAKDWPAAEAAWTELRTQHPEDPAGWVHGAAVSVDLGMKRTRPPCWQPVRRRTRPAHNA